MSILKIIKLKKNLLYKKNHKFNNESTAKREILEIFIS